MKQAKPLTREQYLKKFSRSARWRLSPADAAEAISDYKELVYQEERDETKLVEELGDPIQAAWLLTDAKEYKRWIKVFAILTLGLFLMAKWAWTGMTFVRFAWDYSMYSEGWRGIAVLVVGIIVSQVWFRKCGQKSGALSKWLLLTLAAILIFGLTVMVLSWCILDPKFVAKLAKMEYETVAPQIILYRELIIDGGTVCSVIALAGLLLARLKDRRWLALYTLALTAAVLCIILECWMTRMDITWAEIEDARAILFPELIPVAAAGLIGTGVALC